jgi:L-ribulose-5-phosphate 3-epimerase
VKPESISSARPPSPRAPIILGSPMCFGGFDLWVGYRYLQRTGIRHIEVPALPMRLAAKFDLTTFAPESMDERDLAMLKERFEKMGFTPVTVAAFCDLLDASQTEALRRRIDFAESLGARYVITDATGEGREERRKVINALRWMGDYAGEREIRIALETHEGPTRNGKMAREFLAEVNHPQVGLNYDTGNIYYYNDDLDPAKDIKEIGDKVVHVHLKDTLGGKGEWRFCALGDGRVKFPAIIETLKSAGFNGPYGLEIEGEEGEDLNREQTLQRVIKSLDYLRQIGLINA